MSKRNRKAVRNPITKSSKVHSIAYKQSRQMWTLCWVFYFSFFISFRLFFCVSLSRLFFSVNHESYNRIILLFRVHILILSQQMIFHIHGAFSISPRTFWYVNLIWNRKNPFFFSYDLFDFSSWTRWSFFFLP